MYEASIRSVALVMDGPVPKKNDNGKESVDVSFEIDAENSIRRRYAIGFGQNKANGQWAQFAKFVESASGIKCGDPAQRTVSDEQIIGKRVRIVIETNDRGYSDVVNVMAAPKPNGAVKQKPTPVAVGAYDEPPADNEIPF